LEEIQRFVNKDSKLRVIKGKELAQGWTGKNWAYHQLFNEANGDLLLFLDTDTRLKTGALYCTVNTIQREGMDFISAIPTEEPIT